MYVNCAFLEGKDEDIVSDKEPIIVTAVGYNKFFTGRVNKTTRPNGRGDYQLLYIAAGCAHFYFGDKHRLIHKGTMVLYRPHESQLYNYDSADNPEVYWVHFTGYDVSRILDGFGFPKDENVFFTGVSLDYESYFRKMIRELQTKRANYEEFLKLELRYIFLTMSRHIKESNDMGAEMLNEIERAINYFNRNYNQPIVIDDYAKERAMCTNWFIQKFKQITKLTPMQYILSLRITNAKNLIDSTDHNMTQIAEAVGYDNSMYFSRVFKKHTGMTPTEYKRRNINEI